MVVASASIWAQSSSNSSFIFRCRRKAYHEQLATPCEGRLSGVNLKCILVVASLAALPRNIELIESMKSIEEPCRHLYLYTADPRKAQTFQWFQSHNVLKRLN